MSRLRSLVRGARSSRGAVVVLIALCMPVFILFAGIVIDIGNWFEHKRHLQVQADAGALAGAQSFRFPCDNATILQKVSEYSSVELPGGDDGYNPQVGNTPAEELHQEINSPTFYDQAEPIDESVRGPIDDPCAAKMIDVKLTETNLPWWLKVAQVPYINAHARVEFKQQTQATGALPVGVPEIDPRKVKAFFVDESLPETDANYVLASTELERGATSGGLTTWDNSGAPLPVDIDVADIGVRVAVSSSTSTTCGDVLVACYDSGTDNGLAHIRGWSSTPAGGSTTATPPRARDVELYGGTCEDGYFTGTAASYPCTVNVAAVVDFGGASTATTRVLAKKTGANNNTYVRLNPPAAAGDPWTGGAISIAANSGPTSIDLRWQSGCPSNGNGNCSGGGTRTGEIGTVQRTFSASTALAGPIKLVRVSEAGIAGANSFQRCASGCSHDLVVTVGLSENLQNASSTSDPIVELKVAGGGSQNQSLRCGDAVRPLKDELAEGCTTTYAVNVGNACPATFGDLWDTAEPWDCVAVDQGAQTNQVPQGMNLRMFGVDNASVCTAPNNWDDFPNFPPGDPRIVTLFLTEFGSFQASGGEVIPVTGFATFYVTGWRGQGNGFANPCADDDDPVGSGSIVGHFIKYINTINNGGGGEEYCDFNAFGSCVAEFTR